MAVTTQKSTQVTNMDATPPTIMDTTSLHGRLRVAFFAHTQDGAGDATSTVDLVKLPTGTGRILVRSSFLAASAFGSSRTLDIGYVAHTDTNGDAVAVDVDAVLDGLDVSGATNAMLGTGTNTVDTYLYDSNAPLTIQAVVAGGTIPDTATLSGYIVYVLD
tara:strand:+ start:43 stop:525 length:483 start_codon:yes stop_codon:yes gene_type:complete